MSEQTSVVTGLQIAGCANPSVVHGFPLTDPYIERCWSSALGPTAVLVARRFGFLLEHAPGVRMDAAELARSVGVGVNRAGPGVGATSPLMRALDRLERFGFLVQHREGHEVHLMVWLEVPGLPPTQLRRAPASTVALHRELIAVRIGRDASRKSAVELAVVSPVRQIGDGGRLRRPSPAKGVQAPSGMGR